MMERTDFRVKSLVTDNLSLKFSSDIQVQIKEKRCTSVEFRGEFQPRYKFKSSRSINYLIDENTQGVSVDKEEKSEN